jgi:diguanylate cyclase (GGDEF)-like protein
MAKILIVDDSPVEIKIIRRLLPDEYEIIEAGDGQTAIELAISTLPDIILLDVIMPGLDGYSACRALKSIPAIADTPVIFITVLANSQDMIKGFDAGGQDYVTKPFNSPELCARIKVHLELKRSKEKLLDYAKELEAKNRELNQLVVKLENTAMTDYVTGLENRRSMTRRIKEQLAGLIRSGGNATLILADIDDFKKVNDTFGHECGDAVLKDVAELMKLVVREDTVIARWGGEEFLLMLPDTDLAGGRVSAGRLREVIETAAFSYQEKTFSVTLTLGVAELDQDYGFDVSIRNADEALYRGKNMSKNCVVCFQPR